MLYVEDNGSQNIDFSNMNFKEILEKINELLHVKKGKK